MRRQKSIHSHFLSHFHSEILPAPEASFPLLPRFVLFLFLFLFLIITDGSEKRHLILCLYEIRVYKPYVCSCLNP